MSDPDRPGTTIVITSIDAVAVILGLVVGCALAVGAWIAR